MFKKLTKSLKKAFTITELVIVIAVIAILAAVLIPTFSNVVSSAKQSAALSTCKNALTDLEAQYAGEGKTSEKLWGTGFSSNGYYYVFFNGQLYYLGTIDTTTNAVELSDEGDVMEMNFINSSSAKSYSGTGTGVTSAELAKYLVIDQTDGGKVSFATTSSYTYASTAPTVSESVGTNKDIVVAYILTVGTDEYVGIFGIETGTSTSKYLAEGAYYSETGTIAKIGSYWSLISE